MKILLVSIFMPSPENRRGPSQLIFDLSRYAPCNVEIDLLVYGDESCTTPNETHELFNEIRIIKPEKLSSIRYSVSARLPRRIYSPPGDIEYHSYDLIWLYQEWLYYEYKKIHSNVLVTGMDCSVMLYSRSLLKNPLYRSLSMFFKVLRSLHLENCIGQGHCFHTVGEFDLSFFKRINKRASAFYSPHPLPSYRVNKKSTFNEREVVTIALTGGFSKFYHGNLIHQILRVFEKRKKLDKLRWFFLGKGWEFAANRLRLVGYEVEHETWVEDYQSFMDEVDIHLVPIQVGAGTKGKVLHSVASGIVTLGSGYAYENILDSQDSPLVFRNAIEVHSRILQFIEDRKTFTSVTAEIADYTRDCFEPGTAVQLFWDNVMAYLSHKPSEG